MLSNLIKENIVVEIKIILNLQPELAYGVTGNTSGFGPEESRFDP